MFYFSNDNSSSISFRYVIAFLSFVALFDGVKTSSVRSLQDDCSQDLKNTLVLTDTLTLHWDVDYGSSAGMHVLQVCMRSETGGWLGFGVSPSGMMVGAEAVIGLPDENTVLKYSLNGKGPTSVVAMNATNQTLMGRNIQQENGVTVLSFEKYLKEGKDPIKHGQNNTFIYAEAASNAFGYHGPLRGNVTLFFEEAPIPTLRPTSMGKSSKKLSKSSKVKSNEAGKSTKDEIGKGGKSTEDEIGKAGKSNYSSKSTNPGKSSK